jgi:hypothetical protein
VRWLDRGRRDWVPVGTGIREVVASVVLINADTEGMRRRSYPCLPVLKEAYGLRNFDHRGSQSSIDFAGTGSETCRG